MEKKAKFLYRESGRGWNASLVYEYRGHTYTVDNALFTRPCDQHRMAQERIDSEIEREEQAKEWEKSHEHRYEDTAEYGFQMFWKMVNGEEETE